MLLAMDIGNTNIAIGIFEGVKLIKNWKIKSEREKTCDEYTISLLNLLSISGPKCSKIQAVIISSVVPPLTPIFQKLSLNLFKLKPFEVGPGLKTGMPILYDNPQEVLLILELQQHLMLFPQEVNI